MNIITLAVILSSSVPPVIRAVFTVPNIIVQNSMACRVYRFLKLGIISNTAQTFTLRSDRFNLRCLVDMSNPNGGTRTQTTAEVSTAHPHLTTPTLPNVAHSEGLLPLQLQVHIAKEVDVDVESKIERGFKLGELA